MPLHCGGAAPRCIICRMSLNPYVFSVPPGDHLQISVIWGAWWEELVTLYDLTTAEVMFNFDNYVQPGILQTFTFQNTGETARAFALHAGYKMSPPNGQVPWNDSQPVLAGFSGFSITIYYYTNEYRTHPNIQVTVSLGTKSLPDGNVFQGYLSRTSNEREQRAAISAYLKANNDTLKKLIADAEACHTAPAGD